VRSCRVVAIVGLALGSCTSGTVASGSASQQVVPSREIRAIYSGPFGGTTRILILKQVRGSISGSLAFRFARARHLVISSDSMFSALERAHRDTYGCQTTAPAVYEADCIVSFRRPEAWHRVLQRLEALPPPPSAPVPANGALLVCDDGLHVAVEVRENGRRSLRSYSPCGAEGGEPAERELWAILADVLASAERHQIGAA
jgi:hypothetical protein